MFSAYAVSPKHSSWALAAWLAAAPVLLTAAGALAQTTQPAAPQSGTMPFCDPTFGFEMQLPAWWTYDRARFQGPAGALGLLRGHDASGNQALQILIFRGTEATAFDRWLSDFKGKLAVLHGKAHIAQRNLKSANRQRTIFVIDPQVGASRTVTHYLCISFDPNTVWTLVLASVISTPAEQEALDKAFDTLAESVNVLYEPLEVKQISAAFDRGLEILKSLRATATQVEIDPTERYYEISIEGKPIGYLMRWQRRENEALTDPRIRGSKHKDGLRVSEVSWRFADDGTARSTELNLFTSFDQRSELIENHNTQVPAPDAPTQRLYIELDQCVREDDTLFSSFSTNLQPNLPDPRPPLPIGPRYLGLAWVRMLPELLLNKPSEDYAFAVYDLQVRALSVHLIRPLGPATVPGPGGGSGFAFETRDGFVTQPSKLYTDDKGNLLRMESGTFALAPISRAEAEQRYGARRDAAQAKMGPSAKPSAKP